MPYITDLENAGQRAALQPVPAAPALTILEQQAGRQRSKRRLIASSVVALAFLAIALPVGLNLRGRTEVQTVAAGAAAGASAVQDPTPEGATGVGAATQPDSEDQSDSEEATIELRYGSDVALSIRVLSGDEAQAAAERAEAGADETRSIDDVVVWITRDGDSATISALVEPDEFIEVTGPGDQLERLLEVIEQGGPFVFGAHDGFGSFFGQDGDHPNFERFFEDFDGELPDFEGGFGEFGDFERFFDEGDFGDFERFFDEGGFGDFERFFDEGGLGEFGDFGRFFDEGGLGEFGDFDGCIAIEVDHEGGFHFEFPEGCSAGA